MSIRRGTTPTHYFDLPVEAGRITLLSLAYAQRGEVKIEKHLNDVVLADMRGSCKLKESDTLKLVDGIDVEIQLRVGTANDRYASDVVEEPVEKILKDGMLI